MKTPDFRSSVVDYFSLGFRDGNDPSLLEISSAFVAVCFVIAAPVAYYAVKRWLEGFAY
jgi:hypothetical protein